MGFLRSLGSLMSKAAGGGKATANWEDNLTEEMIADLEKQGCDMAEIRQRFEAKQAQEKQAKQQLIDRSLAMIDMAKLAPHMVTPRTVESEFVQAVATLGKLSSKRQQKLVEAPLVYGAVVQAHYMLWEPANNDDSMGVVFVFAMDKAHMHDEAFLRKMADKIAEMKKNGSEPMDCSKFIKTLRDDQSMFCFKVGDSVSEGADLWCATYTWNKRSALPGGYLPATKIVPLLVLDYPEVNQFAEFEKIPVAYYTK